MSRLTLRHLEIFAVLPRYPTLSAAAAKLHISESTLSQLVTETIMAQQLCLRRRGRGLMMTDAGTHFSRRAHEIVDQTRDLKHELAGFAGRLSGPVHLGCHAGLAGANLPRPVQGFSTPPPRGGHPRHHRRRR